MRCPRSPVRTIATWLLISTLAPGCSFVKSRGPAQGYRPTADPKCTTSRQPPIVDAVIGGLFAIGTVSAATQASGASGATQAQRDAQSALPGLVIITGALAASSTFGFIQTNRCAVALADWDKAQEDRRQEALVRAEVARHEAQMKEEAAAEEARRQEEARRLQVEEARARENAEREKQAREKADRIATNRSAALQTANLRLVNAYAESIFNVEMVLPDSDETFHIALNERVGGRTSKTFSNAVSGRQGQRVFIHVSAMSLGKWTDFGSKSVYIQPDGTLMVVYDWDVATASFRLQTGWK